MDSHDEMAISDLLGRWRKLPAQDKAKIDGETVATARDLFIRLALAESPDLLKDPDPTRLRQLADFSFDAGVVFADALVERNKL